MWIIATLATTQNLPPKKKEKKPLILVALNLGLQFSVREEAERTCKGRKLAQGHGSRREVSHLRVSLAVEAGKKGSALH
jgi:hypothetical protein